MDPVVLKKSCDACTSSKVKCSGGFPCQRCQQRNVDCFFSPRKRRAKPNKAKKAKNSESTDFMDKEGLEGDTAIIQTATKTFDPTVPMESLVEWERRSWSVFFTLYKHYGTGCSLKWFNKQLHKMREYLSKQGSRESLKRLTSWMTALNIDVDALAEEVAFCSVRCKESVSRLQLKVDGTVKDPTQQLTAKLQASNERAPFLKILSEHPLIGDSENVKITCNKAFHSVFGLTEAALQAQLNWTAGGFLPWGGDILARILTKEKDLLAFVQILAIKFNSLSKPQACPMIRDVPSCHMFEVNVRESANSHILVPVNALIKCMHREILDDDKTAMEISMEFIPLVPYDHLLITDRPLVSDIVSTPSSCSITTANELAGTSPCILNVKQDVVPFSTKHSDRKRNFTEDEEFEDDEEEYESEEKFDEYKPHYKSSSTLLAGELENEHSSTSSNTPTDHSNSNSTTSIPPRGGYASKNPVLPRQHSFDMGGANLMDNGQYFQNTNDADSVFDDQANWLDGLLDWAKA